MLGNYEMSKQECKYILVFAGSVNFWCLFCSSIPNIATTFIATLLTKSLESQCNTMKSTHLVWSSGSKFSNCIVLIVSSTLFALFAYSNSLKNLKSSVMKTSNLRSSTLAMSGKQCEIHYPSISDYEMLTDVLRFHKGIAKCFVLSYDHVEFIDFLQL